MVFPSPAGDYVEKSVTPNEACKWFSRPGQFLMRAGDASWRAGIKKDVILVIDTARKPLEGSIVIATICGEFCMKRMRFYPTLALQSLDQPDVAMLIESGDLEGEETMIFGVVTFIINDATTDEFDDIPCI
ncbi:HumD family translesion DNA polymerase [Rahnella sp. PCH160]|uniref:HumD family translesion DNA polymerase n=1 Tax=Rahnella sp. PCH160 TaxID=3447928 RepID=UPI0039FC3CD0